MIDIRRIGAADGSELRAIRLAALSDAPTAFGSTHAAEAGRSDAEWSERALASTGVERVTFLARSGARTVGIASGYRKEQQSAEVHLVSMWTAPAPADCSSAR